MPIQQIDCNEAKRILDEDPNAIYVDVRSIPEFTQGHPIRALNIPLMHRGPAGMTPNPEFEKVATQVLSKDKKLLVGCMAGGRSQRACEILEAHGYGNLSNVCGGFGGGRHPETGEPLAGWKDLGLPTSTDNGEGVSYESLAAKAK